MPLSVVGIVGSSLIHRCSNRVSLVLWNDHLFDSLAGLITEMALDDKPPSADGNDDPVAEDSFERIPRARMM